MAVEQRAQDCYVVAPRTAETWTRNLLIADWRLNRCAIT